MFIQTGYESTSLTSLSTVPAEIGLLLMFCWTEWDETVNLGSWITAKG